MEEWTSNWVIAERNRCEHASSEGGVLGVHMTDASSPVVTDVLNVLGESKRVEDFVWFSRDGNPTAAVPAMRVGVKRRGRLSRRP